MFGLSSFSLGWLEGEKTYDTLWHAVCWLEEWYSSMGWWFTYVASVSKIASSGAWLVQLSSRTEVTTKYVGNSSLDSNAWVKDLSS